METLRLPASEEHAGLRADAFLALMVEGRGASAGGGPGPLRPETHRQELSTGGKRDSGGRPAGTGTRGSRAAEYPAECGL